MAPIDLLFIEIATTKVFSTHVFLSPIKKKNLSFNWLTVVASTQTHLLHPIFPANHPLYLRSKVQPA